MYYIQNDGYLGNALIWWGEESRGYTCDISKAGKYTKEQAKNICKRPEDTAWECDYIDNLEIAKKVIVDAQYVDRKYSRAWRGRAK